MHVAGTHDHLSLDTPLHPFHTYILKVASRCNINCSYCFIYNKADQQWRKQPKFMSQSTLSMLCSRVVEHCASHNKRSVSLIFHGGEPLLAGTKRIRTYLDIISRVLSSAKLSYSVGVQTNGTLITEDLLELFLEYDVAVGVSLDGPPYVNDRQRLTHTGTGSSKDIEAGLKLLLSDRHRKLFRGFLSVVDVTADPLEVYRYLASFDPPSIDFLLPYDNWDHRPPGKEIAASVTYGIWLKRVFDEWYDSNSAIRVRQFDSYLRIMLGGVSVIESVGLRPVDILVLETNGDMEGVDSLKAAFDGATSLGYNVFQHGLDSAASHVAVRSRQLGATSLSCQCRSCGVLEVCGGGYLPNRYSAARGFDNPSIYCSDLQLLIEHIGDRATASLANRTSSAGS